MKAAAKCDKRFDLHDSVNHLKIERTLLFRVFLERMFSWMMDVWARTTMKAAAKCDKHCDLHDSVNL